MFIPGCCTLTGTFSCLCLLGRGLIIFYFVIPENYFKRQNKERLRKFIIISNRLIYFRRKGHNEVVNSAMPAELKKYKPHNAVK